MALFKEWETEIENIDVDNLCDLVESNSENSLLNAYKVRNNPENFFDNLIGDIVAYHLHRVNMRVSNFSYLNNYDYNNENIIEQDNIHVEYWFKSENSSYLHKDYDEYQRNCIKKGNNKMMFTGILYLTKSKTPTLIYDEERKDIGIIFPELMKQIIFRGGDMLHGSIDDLYENNDRRVVIAFAAYSEDVKYTPYLDMNQIYQRFYMNRHKEVKELKNKYEIKMKGKEIDVTKFSTTDIFHTNFFDKLSENNKERQEEYEFIRSQINNEGSYFLKYNRLDNWDTLYKIEEEEEKEEKDENNIFPIHGEKSDENGALDVLDNQVLDGILISEETIEKTKFSNVFLERNIIDGPTCDWLCYEAKEIVKKKGGWENNRHVRYPTYDISVDDLDASTKRNILFMFREKIYSKLFELYDMEKTDYTTDIRDAFIVRYSVDTQSFLDYHSDDAVMSAMILLNDPKCFEGGGTKFANGLKIQSNKGDCLIFCSKNKHSGLEITYGERFVLVFFIRVIKSIN
jgi:hypothetical protein